GGGAVAAPMRRGPRRPPETLGAPAPNRSGDGAPASPHRGRSPLQPVLLDLPVQPLPVDPEQPRGLVLVAPALAQRGGEQAALGLLERRHVARIDGGRV